MSTEQKGNKSFLFDPGKGTHGLVHPEGKTTRLRDLTVLKHFKFRGRLEIHQKTSKESKSNDIHTLCRVTGKQAWCKKDTLVQAIRFLAPTK